MDIPKILSELRGEDQEELEDEKDSFFPKYKEKYPTLTSENFSRLAIHIITGKTNDEDLILIEDKPTVIEEITKKQEKPKTIILRFNANLPPYQKPVDLEEIYKTLILDENLLSKTFYDHPVERASTGTSSIDKIIDEYLYSEHNKGTLKKLKQGIISCLYYSTNTRINCTISDTGVVGLVIFPIIFDLVQHKKDIGDFYKKLSGKNIEGILEFKNIDVKILYPTSYGYFTKETIANYENVGIVNNIVKIKSNNTEILYSSNDKSLNFTINDVETFEKIKDIEETVEIKVKNYILNLTKFRGKSIENGEIYIKPENYKNVNIKDYVRITETNTELDGIHKIKSIRNSGFTVEYFGPLKEIKGEYILTSVLKKVDVKELRSGGLVVDSTKCEKKRRPVAYSGPDSGEDILVINENKYKCPVDYPYHGLKDKVNCCFKKKPKQEVLQGQQVIDTITSMRHLFKKTPLKKYTNMKKFSHKVIDGSTAHYFGENFFIMSPDDQKENRTITNCLKIAYGEDVEKSIKELTEEQYKYLENNSPIEVWRETENKSIDDILYAVSMLKKINIIIIQEDLVTKCTKISDFDKIVIVYKYTDNSYYIVVDKNFGYEHQASEFKKLVEDYSKSCDVEQIKGINSYTIIMNRQILDIQGLVVFLEMKNLGLIPVTPSTVISSIPAIEITSTEFKLLTPESQYNSLKSVSSEYPELEPIGITRGLTSRLVTGIKIKNGGICPVSQQEWETNLLEEVEDLFYIERYYNKEDTFQNEEEKFTENLQKVKNLNNETLMSFINSNDYPALVNYLKTNLVDIEEDILSKLVWYLINNEGI
jgi:hypothetical protein